MLLHSKTPFSGPTIRMYAPSSPLQHFFSSVSWSRGIKPVGTGYGPPHAPRKSKFSSGRLCVTVSPPKLSSYLAGRLWIYDARDVNIRKLRFTFFETVLGQKRSGANHQVCYLFPFSNCHFKNGCDGTRRWMGLRYHTISRGKSISPSHVGSFG